MTDDDRTRKIVECVASLFTSIYEAGGDPARVMEKGLGKNRPAPMTLVEFIAEIAGPNQIRFVFRDRYERETVVIPQKNER